MTVGASNGYQSFAQVRRHPVWQASPALKTAAPTPRFATPRIGTALGLALQQPYNSKDNMGNCGPVLVGAWAAQCQRPRSRG
jgi:hypothetical protein